MKMPFKYFKSNLYFSNDGMTFIRHWNVLGEFFSANKIRIKLKRLLFEVKTVLHSLFCQFLLTCTHYPHLAWSVTHLCQCKRCICSQTVWETNPILSALSAFAVDTEPYSSASLLQRQYGLLIRFALAVRLLVRSLCQSPSCPTLSLFWPCTVRFRKWELNTVTESSHRKFCNVHSLKLFFPLLLKIKELVDKYFTLHRILVELLSSFIPVLQILRYGFL